ncbi:MAG: autotransporter-associated beta strand repeat-containing protein [Verrucomicrobiota bacterium]
MGNSSTVSNSILTISGVASNTTYAGVLQDVLGSGTRKLGLTVGAGTFTLSASNTFSGDTRLQGGTLVLANLNALRNSTVDFQTDDTGLLSFGSLASAVVGGVKGTRDLALTNSTATAFTLTVGNNFSGTNTFYGALTGGAASVLKTGNGTLILAGENTFSGTLFVDTAQPSTGNDGVLRLASSGALNGASAIQIRNQNSATSTLQLDGSGGNISLPQPVTLNGRNNSTPAIQNLAGDNSFAGNVTLGSGGTTYLIQCDADTLAFNGVVGIQSLTSARTLTFQGAGNFLVTGTITNGATFSNAVVKLGAGTLTLAGTNAYAGTTSVTNGGLRVNGSIGTNAVAIANGSLGGNGLIRGPVTLTGASTMTPGNNNVGTLTVSNAVTLAGTTVMELNRAAAPNSDRLAANSLTYAGVLVVTNIGANLQVNDTFDLFDWAVTRLGSFTSIVLPAGYTWNTNNLTLNGTISVTAVDPPPVLNYAVTETGLQFSWAGNFKLQYQVTTADVGLMPEMAAWLDYAGGDSSPVVVPVDTAEGAVFFRLVQKP